LIHGGFVCLASQGHVQGNVQRSQMPNEQQQQQQGVGATGFALQLVQRGLEESLGAVQRAIHEEVQNLHLELLRQFHIQQVGGICLFPEFLC
jgi:protein NEDD1